ncbi:cytosine deaminase [Pararoseomonas sp. SCSIO 73927]|uniref:cytosine deaminase n=1 Tax=Pararoseomonas sp. SCSIO 73927 TaxID=3114537 RepID=UPI0030CE21E5
MLLHRASVPAVLAEGDLGPADADGLVLADIRIDAGRIAAVTPAAPTPPEGALDLDRSQVWPGLVDPHAHLDKAHILPRARNPDGTHPGAVKAVGEDRAAHWTAEDVRRRFTFALRCAEANGVVAIRTHLDSHGPQAALTWPVFAELREEWRDRITLQAAALVAITAYAGEEGEALAARVAATGGLLGGNTRIPDDKDGAELEASLDGLFRLAMKHGLDIDLHVDESGDPNAATLGPIARAALRHRFPGRLTCGHCCSLAVQEPEAADRVMDLVAQAGITIISLPPVNQYLQDRVPGRTPRWRGVTLLHELRARGITVLIGGDNCRDPFYGYGDHDPIETFTDSVRIAHLDKPIGDWPAAITARPADLMGLPDHGRIRAGAAADLVLFRGRTMDELLSRRRGPRVVLCNGRPTPVELPDYRELDDLL